MDEGLSVCVPDDSTGNAKLMFSILECLSKNARNTVLFLMDHIKLIHLNADRNKMTSQALAICFGPLFSCHAESESVHKAIQVFKFLLDMWPQRRGTVTHCTTTATVHSSRGFTTRGGIPPRRDFAHKPSSSSISSQSKGSFNFIRKIDDVKQIQQQKGPLPGESVKVSGPVIGSTSTVAGSGSGSIGGGGGGAPTSMVTMKGGQIQISERNPFRGLVGSMNAATTSDDYPPGGGGGPRGGYGSTASGPIATTSITSSITSTLYDSPPGSHHRYLDRSSRSAIASTSTGAAVTTSISWISSSSGSSSGGRMLPSTQSATRTISTYSNQVVSQSKYPPGSTGPSVLNSSTNNPSATSTSSTSYMNRYSTSTSTTTSAYDPHYTTSTSMSSSYHQYDKSSSSIDPTSSTTPYHRMNHITSSTYDPIGSSTTTSASTTLPYYAAYLNSSSSTTSGIPLTDATSPSKRTTITSSYLTSATSGPEAIYSTVNKPSRTTDLYATGASITTAPGGGSGIGGTSGAPSSYYRRDITAGLDDDDLPSYRTSIDRDYSSGLTSAPGGALGTSSYSSYSDAGSGITSSGIGSSSKYRGTTAAITNDFDLATKSTSARPYGSNYLSDYNTTSTIADITSPPTGLTGYTGIGSSTTDPPLIKPLIGAYGTSSATTGTGSASSGAISTQLYPSKFNSTSAITTQQQSTSNSATSYLYSSGGGSGGSSGYGGTSTGITSSLDRSSNGIGSSNTTGSYRSSYSNI